MSPREEVVERLQEEYAEKFDAQQKLNDHLIFENNKLRLKTRKALVALKIARDMFTGQNADYPHVKAVNDAIDEISEQPATCDAVELSRMREALQEIADATDPDDPESYRSDDREGCLDTVQTIARTALNGASK